MKLGVKVILAAPSCLFDESDLESQITSWLRENSDKTIRFVAQSQSQDGPQGGPLIAHTIYYEEREPTSLEMAAADSNLE